MTEADLDYYEAQYKQVGFVARSIGIEISTGTLRSSAAERRQN
jgi:hypothetical protein